MINVQFLCNLTVSKFHSIDERNSDLNVLQTAPRPGSMLLIKSQLFGTFSLLSSLKYKTKYLEYAGFLELLCFAITTFFEIGVDFEIHYCIPAPTPDTLAICPLQNLKMYHELKITTVFKNPFPFKNLPDNATLAKQIK
jgi:hypothetical protein